jgi:hypothetical protein
MEINREVKNNLNEKIIGEADREVDKISQNCSEGKEVISGKEVSMLKRNTNSFSGLNSVAEEGTSLTPNVAKEATDSEKNSQENEVKPVSQPLPIAGSTVNRRMPHLHKLEK